MKKSLLVSDDSVAEVQQLYRLFLQQKVVWANTIVAKNVESIFRFTNLNLDISIRYVHTLEKCFISNAVFFSYRQLAQIG